ncbi:hypothetical protein [Phycisphaera mikurensis]|uniref:Uncharacterized protein n=1 Tax=Phycisphaera mikurensis (strain NBRC 102666 / KCTC 22515 / FYK2301M01) TaxID=1142394 RepID=I0IHJ6_PHYMF|nr:hypothetical protein [Phycisphaera mikurensis]MBB6440978.1 hypothetical protein [Phycisphaera mikurensis]BAM04734.1 hypothetical protein PSMK_25750 [Phycisphaera mikurensis NBRC 102666]
MLRLRRPLRLAAAALATLLPASLACAEAADRADLWGNAVAGSPGHATQLQRLAEARRADRAVARGRDFDRYDRSSLDRLRGHRNGGPVVVISGSRDLRFGPAHPRGGLRERVLDQADRHRLHRQRITLGGGEVLVRGNTRGVVVVSPGTDRFVAAERWLHGRDACPPRRTGFTRHGRSGFGSSREGRAFRDGFRDGFDAGSRSGLRSWSTERSRGASIEFGFGHRD